MSKGLQSKHSLREFIKNALNDYFSALQETEASGVYNMVVSEVELAMLESVMNYAKGNQSKAALLLGLNRGTLRKLLEKYNLLQ